MGTLILSRQQLGSFLPNHELVKQFEKLIFVVNNLEAEVMGSTVKPLVEAKYIEDTVALQYEAVAVRTIIDKCTIHNTDGVNKTVKIFIHKNNVPDNSEMVYEARLQSNATDECTPIVGHALSPGTKLSMEASQSNMLVLRISGREIS